MADVAIHSGDPEYNDIYDSWIEEGKPFKLLVGGIGYYQYSQGDDVFFVRIDRNDRKYLDPVDRNGLWNRVYGYMRNESNPS